MRFLPSTAFTPVFPPTLESTIASRVVGTCTSGRPRSALAAEVAQLFAERGFTLDVAFAPYRTGSAFLVRKLETVSTA